MGTGTYYERVEEIRGHKFISLKSGRKFSFSDAMSAAKQATSSYSTAIARGFKLRRDAGDPDLVDWELERLEDALDRMDEYVAHCRSELKALRRAQNDRLKIAQLRNVAGRTPAEREAFLQKADELEAKLPKGVD